MDTRTFPEMPTMPTASSLLSVYASLSASIMIFRTMFEQIVPAQLRRYAVDVAKHYWKPNTSQLILLFEEKDGYNPNEMFNAAQLYLSTRITRDSKRLKITKSMKEKHINIKLAESEVIVDSFEGVKVTWTYLSQQQKKMNGENDDGHSYVSEKKYMELKFDKNYKDVIITSYLPFIIKKAQEVKLQKKVVQLHNLRSPHSSHFNYKQSVNLDHPSTFETLAMDQKIKKEIMDDLDLFVRRKEFYKKVGKAWKRGYLLYGPPGTGKSSLVAAMANYLKFDIYDLQLMNVKDDSSLKDILLDTSNRSILLIEDIDCSILPDRTGPTLPTALPRLNDPKFSLSGLLNFIDGLWSCCGDERIIIFTTNHKDRLDPALLRPGRMDMHIHMSYLTMDGFRTLAANYLNIHDHHWRFREIKELIKSNKVTPAEVAEELMKSDNVEVVLEGLVKFLKRKRIGDDENHQIENGVHDEEAEIREAKKTKIIS